MEDISSINFKAQPLNKINIQMYEKKSKNFIPYTVTFVKLDASNKMDMEVVEKSAKTWKNSKYIQRIATASHWMDTVPIEVYALTRQKNNFNKLNHNKILGFAEMRPDNNDERFAALYRLQVREEARTINNPKNKTYKKVGSSILASLKNIYQNISLFSDGGTALEQFYTKNNFIKDSAYPTRFLWSSDYLMKLKIYFENIRKRLGR